MDARPPAPTTPILWTTQDVARFLRKSPRWVQYATQASAAVPGSIPHVRLGRSVRFDPELVQAWVKQGCPPAATFSAWRQSRKSANAPQNAS